MKTNTDTNEATRTASSPATGSTQHEEACRETLNHVHEDMRELVSYDDLWNLVLWLERKADDIRNEAVGKLTDIGLEALKQLKNQL